jgi:hypothetical protein
MSPPVTHLPEVDPSPPARSTRESAERSARRRRRTWLRPLSWVTTAALTGLLIALGTGLIPTEITQTGTPASVVPHRVDPTQGWGRPSSYTGRYVLRGLRASGGGTTPAQGSLLLFLRSEGPDDPLLPSGVLSLSGGRGNLVGYLTELRVRGQDVRAAVRGGTFQGPVIGSLRGAVDGPGAFRATIRAPGIGTVAGEFHRVSRTSGYAQAQPLP